MERGRSELGFCLLRVGGSKRVVKVYYLKLTKKKFLSRVGGGGLDRPSPTLLDQPIVFIDIISSNIIFGSDKQ